MVIHAGCGCSCGCLTECRRGAVVPVEADKWVEDPFGAQRRANGDIYGRGAQDMKCVCIQYIEAIRRCIRAGKRFPRTIHMSFVPDEEIGGHDGMLALLDSDVFRRMNVGLALDEGLANPTDAMSLYNAERAPWCRRTRRGGGHSTSGRLMLRPPLLSSSPRARCGARAWACRGPRHGHRTAGPRQPPDREHGDGEARARHR